MKRMVHLLICLRPEGRDNLFFAERTTAVEEVEEEFQRAGHAPADYGLFSEEDGRLTERLNANMSRLLTLSPFSPGWLRRRLSHRDDLRPWGEIKHIASRLPSPADSRLVQRNRRRWY